MAYTCSSRGGGKEPSGAGKPDGSDCFQRLEERLAGLVEQIAQQQAFAGANQTPSSVQTFRGSTAPPDSVASPTVAEVAAAIAAGAPPVVVVEANQTTATTGVAPSLTEPTTATEDDSLSAERARARANVVMFRKFDPPTYDGEIPDPLLVVNWVNTMEKLFNSFFIEEREKVPLAMHYLKGSADAWLTDLQRNHNTNNPFPSWSAFKEKFFEAFFPDSVKHQLEIDLYNLRQGSQTVWEYKREFSRLICCIPHVIRSDCHMAQMFLAGIRLDIYRLVQAAKLQTYDEVVDRALHVEHGQAIVAKREAMDKEKKKKRPYSRSGGGSSCSKKPSNHPQSYFVAESASIGSQQQRAQSCVICGGLHRVTSCPQGAGRCYRCGQSGHVKANCSERSNVA